MLIPSHEKSESFLRSIDRVVEQCDGHSHPWLLSDSHGSEIQRFKYWHELWIFILQYAAYTLHHERASNLLMDAYEQGDSRVRRKIRAWLADYNLSQHARDEISKLLDREGFKPISFEALPNSWKTRLRRILRSEHGGACLTYRSSMEIARFEKLRYSRFTRYPLREQRGKRLSGLPVSDCHLPRRSGMR